MVRSNLRIILYNTRRERLGVLLRVKTNKAGSSISAEE
jgi:hypothetical protein